MEYYVYENWTIDKAIVHKADCSYCNHGKGLHGGRSGKNSKWHEAYADSQKAFAAAQATNRKDIRGCKTCSPQGE